MDISCIKLPRGVDADSDDIRQALSARTVRLWSGSDLSIPLINVSDPLKKTLQQANLNGFIRCGLEAISDKLDSEKRGLDHLRKGKGLQGGERVSRLLLVSNDGAERFYRHIEGLLRLHSPRILCCMLDVDSNTVGNIITGKEKQIKAVMAEHKETVATILRTLLVNQL